MQVGVRKTKNPQKFFHFFLLTINLKLTNLCEDTDITSLNSTVHCEIFMKSIGTMLFFICAIKLLRKQSIIKVNICIQK
jgi:hypothetical protein